MECAILNTYLDFIIGWSSFVNLEDKECLQLKVKGLDKLAGMIRKALKMNIGRLKHLLISNFVHVHKEEWPDFTESFKPKF